MPKVLIVEDEKDLADALEYQLVREGYEVAVTSDGISGLEKFKTQGADIVLLDLMLPGMPGEDVCKEIRRSSSVPIVMLTARDQELDKILGLELGADDYVTKPFSTRELIARMKAILRRGAPAGVGGSDGVLEGGGIRLDPDRFEATVSGNEIHLTRKEFEVLELLMENAGRVLTRESLIDQVWGSDYFGDTRTLDVHVKRIRAKCEPDPHNPAHVLTVRGLGYKFVP